MALKAKQLGWIQLLGAIIAGWFGWQAQRWDSVVLAAVFLIMSYHHLTERK